MDDVDEQQMTPAQRRTMRARSARRRQCELIRVDYLRERGWTWTDLRPRHDPYIDDPEQD